MLLLICHETNRAHALSCAFRVRGWVEKKRAMLVRASIVLFPVEGAQTQPNCKSNYGNRNFVCVNYGRDVEGEEGIAVTIGVIRHPHAP